MTMTGTTYTVTLTPQEIEMITTALHGEYKTIREEIAQAQREDVVRRTPVMSAAQTLRNGFAAIIGRRYMGEDA